jgi:hypothetical protein
MDCLNFVLLVPFLNVSFFFSSLLKKSSVQPITTDGPFSFQSNGPDYPRKKGPD